jgi:hypothetical protein
VKYRCSTQYRSTTGWVRSSTLLCKPSPTGARHDVAMQTDLGTAPAAPHNGDVLDKWKDWGSSDREPPQPRKRTTARRHESLSDVRPELSTALVFRSKKSSRQSRRPRQALRRDRGSCRHSLRTVTCITPLSQLLISIVFGRGPDPIEARLNVADISEPLEQRQSRGDRAARLARLRRVGKTFSLISIRCGERWERALHGAASGCEAVIFLMSANWLG